MTDNTQSERNKQITRHFIEEVLNKGNLDVMDELMAPDFVSHSHGTKGREAYRAVLEGIRRAFPDLQGTIDIMVAEGEWVAVRTTVAHTHLGPFMGVEPTGVHGTHTGMAFVRIVDGQMVEFWEEADMLGLLQQLGAVP
ncbi:MAG: ester cyclase, partial [Chloroflexota bacterium]